MLDEMFYAVRPPIIIKYSSSCCYSYWF